MCLSLSYCHGSISGWSGLFLILVSSDTMHVFLLGDVRWFHFRPERNLKAITEASSNLDDPTLGPCPTFPDCGFRQPNSGVALSCLDCFLRNGSLYRFEYGVQHQFFFPEYGVAHVLPHHRIHRRMLSTEQRIFFKMGLVTMMCFKTIVKILPCTEKLV
ncbi:hypothetical protein L6164_021253 [Bauhinia variegata]|uniref:Uncharacterized protein n=1 Tax=Bauhinia variegata TaxID=167791 RepID=A0ACB9N378_BAUVA|nr:hypothetical protein L6164_021253 [Bauhinia variegata]